jgi:Tfp pilus assembly major pilin PilA
MNTFILIVIFATSGGQIDNKIVQEFSTKAQCMTALRTAIMNKPQIKRQVLSSGCYPK